MLILRRGQTIVFILANNAVLAIIKIWQLSLPTWEIDFSPFYPIFTFGVNKKKAIGFLLLGALHPAFCFSFSRFRLHILYAIASGEVNIWRNVLNWAI